MKKLSWMLVLALIFVVSSVIMAENAKITKDVIKIQTPKKKSGGEATVVIFDHKKHSEEYAKSCDKCHPPLKQALNAEENTKKVVHETCKTCHSKDKPAKSFKCSSCHVKDSTAEEKK
jgi:membrane-associated HD superfamily phosphohydrolase